MLEFDDIQHILLTRTPALTGRYEFLSFDTPAGGRAWLAGMLDTVQSAADAREPRWTAPSAGSRWRSPGTACGRSACDEASLATFPEEFRQGMAARAEILGDTGANHPEHWVGGLAGADLHAIAILFARDATSSASGAIDEHDKLLARMRRRARCCRTSTSNATPPFDYAHDHFGFRDRLSQPVIEGLGRGADARLGRAAEAGRVHPRLSRRGRPGRQSAAARGAVAQRQLHGLPPAGGARRRVPRLPARERRDAGGAGTARREAHGPLAQRRAAGAGAGQGRSRARAPIRSATTTSTTRRWTRTATPCPLGSHIRRMNPRDTGAQHEPAPDDPPRRHLRSRAARRRARRRRRARHRRVHHLRRAWSASSSSRRTCGSTTRTSTNSATSATRSSAPRTARWNSQIPKRPIRKVHQGLAGLHHRDAAAPTSSCPASRRCATSPALRRQRRSDHMSAPTRPARTYNQNHVAAALHAGRAPHQHLLDVELSLGGQPRPGRDGQPLLHHDRGPQRVAGRATRRPSGTRRTSCRASPARWSCSTAPPWPSRSSSGEATGHPVAVFQRIDQAGYRLPIDERILADTDTLMVFGLDHLRLRAGGRAGGDRRDHASGSSARAPACCWRRTTTSASPTTTSSARWSTSTTATRWCRASSASASTPAR